MANLGMLLNNTASLPEFTMNLGQNSLSCLLDSVSLRLLSFFMQIVCWCKYFDK